jgi:hypothetical protein
MRQDTRPRNFGPPWNSILALTSQKENTSNLISRGNKPEMSRFGGYDQVNWQYREWIALQRNPNLENHGFWAA